MKIGAANPTLSAAVEQKWAKLKENDENRPAGLVETLPDGSLHINNVRWGYQETSSDTSQWKPIYKDTTLDPKDVKDIFIAVEPFAPVALGGGHGEAVIEFNKPFTNADGEQDTRLVVSLEAWKEKGQTWTPMKGLKKNFGVVHQLCTFSDRVQRQARKEGRSIVLHRINMTPEQRETFARNSISDALQDRTGEYYNTISDSCFQNQVVQLNKALPPEHQLHRWTALLHLPRLGMVLPGMAGLVLERYHLRTPDRPIEIGPDAAMHPDKVKAEPGILAKATQHPWFDTSVRLAGIALGASAAGHFAGIPGAVAGALVGNYVAGLGADQARILNSHVHEDPQQFYSPRLRAEIEAKKELA